MGKQILNTPRQQSKLELFARYFYIYFIYTLTYFITTFIINFIQAILWLTVKPFNVKLFRKINKLLCYISLSNCYFLVQWYAPAEMYFYVDEKDKKYLGKEHSFILSNHKYEIDWLLLGVLADAYNFVGNTKVFLKKELQYIPATGWCFYFCEYIFLQRTFEKDKETIKKQIANLVEYTDPICLLMYPEGTRFTQEKYEASLKFSKEKGLPELKYHLTPRTKGFVASLPAMKGKMGAIYDLTITLNPNKPSVTFENILFGRSMEGHIYVRRIPFEQVPQDEKGATKFIHDIFVRKDKLQESYLTTGDYFATSGIERIQSVKLSKSWGSLINHIVCASLVIGTISYNLIKLLFTGSLYNICLVYGLLFLFSFGLSRLFSGVKIENSSTYGKDTKKSK